jgi:hypothetical protein
MQLNPVGTYGTKYVLILRQHDKVHNYDIKVTNKFIKIVAQLKYLGTTITNPNGIHYEINGKCLHLFISYP